MWFIKSWNRNWIKLQLACALFTPLNDVVSFRCRKRLGGWYDKSSTAEWTAAEYEWVQPTAATLRWIPGQQGHQTSTRHTGTGEIDHARKYRIRKKAQHVVQDNPIAIVVSADKAAQNYKIKLFQDKQTTNFDFVFLCFFKIICQPVL